MLPYGLFTLSEPIDDEREIDEGEEHHVQFVESGEDTTEAFKATKQAFNFISALVHFAVVFPWRKTVAFGRNNGNEAKIERELPRFVAFVCLVHKQVQWPIRPSKASQQGAPFWCITRLAGRERERYCCSSIRGNHMNLGGPSTSRFSD